MNHTYRLVWSRALRIWQVASELARTPQGVTVRTAVPASAGPRRRLAVACAVALFGVFAATAPLHAMAQNVGAAGGAGSTGTARGVPSGSWGEGGSGGSAAAQGGTSPAAGGAGGQNGAGGQGTAGSGGGGGGGSYSPYNLYAGGAGGAAGLGWAEGGAGGAGGAGGGGGGGGGGGYAGWYVGNAPAAPIALADAYLGGAGGAGGSADSGNSTASGGGGGSGGGGLVGSAFDLAVQSGASATGGDGGSGGASGGAGSVGGIGGVGGRGGSGGDGVGGSGFTLTNQGSLTGGDGGRGGAAGGPMGGMGGTAGNGGTGGAGVAGSAITVVNTGTITGGNGGNAGDPGSQGASGSVGAGGAGVAASGGSTVINAGTLSGGFGNGGSGARAAAVSFTGGGNTLLLEAGSTLIGNAVSAGGDTLALGGAVDGSFDVTDVVSAPSGSLGGTQYVGFDTLQKTGAATWTVTGTNSSEAGWVLKQGVLSVSSTSGAALGPSVAFDGGTLDFTNSSPATYSGDIVVGANGGILNADGGNATDAFSNTVSLTGSLSGAGELVLNADPASANGLVTFAGTGVTQSVATLTQEHGIVGFGNGRDPVHVTVGTLNVNGSSELTVLPNAVLQIDGTIHAASGSTFMLGGQLDIVSDNAFGIPLGVNGNGALSVAQGATFDLQQGFYGEGMLRLNGAGTVLDSGASSNLMGMTIGSGATFQIGSGGVSDDLAIGPMGMTNDGTLVWNHDDQAAPVFSIGGTGALIQQGSGTLTLSQANTYTGATVVDGGTIAVTGTGSLGTGALGIASGGEVDLANAAQRIASLGGEGNLELGGTALEINGGAMASFAGSIGGNGTLLYDGNGVQILDGNSSGFAGDTTLASGALVVGSVAGNGASLGGNVTVSDGAVLAGHGSIGGNVALLGGGHLAPGHSLGTLTVAGDFSATQGSVLNYEFGAPGADFRNPGNGDSVYVGGNLTLDGAILDVTDLGGMGPGLYDVFTYGGSLSETNGGLVLGTTPAGRSLQLQNLTAQKQINLVDSTGFTLNFWNANGLASDRQMGGGSGTWSAGTQQWTDATGSVPNGAMQPQPGFAIFGGAPGTVTVADGAGAVQARGMQFATDGYVLGGGTLTLADTAPVIRVGDGSGAGAGMTATVNNVLAGDAGLTKTDAGTLVLGGINTYSGGTTITGGTLAVSSDANLGDASGGVTLAGGTLENTAALATARTITLAGQGGLRTDADLVVSGVIAGAGGLDKTGAGTLTLAGVNTYGGGTTISAGTLRGDAHSLQGHIVDNASLVFDQRDDGLFDGTLSGTGQFVLQGGGTLVIDDAGTFNGTTSVGAGTLVVGDDSHAGASLGGLVTVNAGAGLQGIGSIGSLDLAGTIAPGGSVGALHVAGDAVFRKGSIYRLEAQPDGSSDRTVVGGKVSLLGGQVTVLAQPGFTAAHADYTVLSASQGVSGHFDGVSSNLAFLVPVLSYTANTVELSLQRNDISLASVATTANQRAVAGAVDSLGYGQAIYDAVLGMDAAQARASYEALSGELHASTHTALMDDSFHVRDAVDHHLQGRDGQGRSGTRGDVSAWTAAWGHADRVEGDGNATGMKANGGGLLAGADVAVGDQSRLGVFAGSGEQSLRLASRSDSATVHATHAGVYGATQGHAWKLRAGLAYAWQRIDSTRTADLTDAATTDAHYDAGLAHGYVEGAYRFQFGRTGLEPYLDVARMQLRTDAIHESAGTTALNVTEESAGVTTATLGARVRTALDAGGRAQVYADLGWRRAWGAATPTIRARFAAGGSAFAVDGLAIVRHAVAVDAGVNLQLAAHAALDFGYHGQFGHRDKDHAVRLGLTMTF